MASLMNFKRTSVRSRMETPGFQVVYPLPFSIQILLSQWSLPPNYKIAAKITPPWNPIFMTLHYVSSEHVALCNILVSHLFTYCLPPLQSISSHLSVYLYPPCIEQCLVHIISKNISRKEKGGELRIKYFISSLMCLAPKEKCTLEVWIHFWPIFLRFFCPVFYRLFS